MDAEPAIITIDGLRAMLDLLREKGYRVVGPTLRDQAIVYDDIASLADLPAGGTEEQGGGPYRLARREDSALFGYAVGPHSWKKYLHPPVQRLWRAERNSDGVQVTPEPVKEERFAFIGVRACELHAIAIQDRVLMEGAHADPHYRARGKDAFLLAGDFGEGGGTPFFVSM